MASLCTPPPALSSAACLRGGAPVRRSAAAAVRPAARGVLRVRAGNDNEGGVFAPIVVVARNVIGVKQFNQFRGKAISLHSQARGTLAVCGRPRSRASPEQPGRQSEPGLRVPDGERRAAPAGAAARASRARARRGGRRERWNQSGQPRAVPRRTGPRRAHTRSLRPPPRPGPTRAAAGAQSRR
jgi:hypothetical protein